MKNKVTTSATTREALTKMKGALNEIAKFHLKEAKALGKATRRAEKNNALKDADRLADLAERHSGVYESLAYAVKDIDDALTF